MFDWMPIRIFWQDDDGTGGGQPDPPKKNKIIEDETAAIYRRIEAKKLELELEAELARQSGLTYDAKLKENEIKAQDIKIQEEAIKLLKLTGDQYEAKLKALETEIDLYKEREPLTSEEQSKLDALLLLQEKMVELKGKDYIQEVKALKLRKEDNAQLDANIEFQKNASEATGKFIAQKLKLNEISMVLQNRQAIGNLLMDKVVKMAFDAAVAYDNQRAGLAKITGGVTVYNQGLANTMQAAAGANLSLSEAAEGFSKLAGSMVAFSEVSSATRQELSLLTAGFSKFGVDITGNLNIATKAMGLTGSEAGALQRELFAVGTALGPHMTKKVMSEFGPAMSTLAAFTNERAIKVFKGLAAQSQATGLAISELISISSKFDTYDGAAESVGRLNSILGGDYLNSVQMLNASEEDRIKMLQQSISLSGRQFSDLSRFEKKALASAAGISDMSKAMQVFGTDSEKLADFEAKASKAGMSVEKFKEATAATNNIQQQFQVIMQNLAVVMKPVVDLLLLTLQGLRFIAPVLKIVVFGWIAYTAAQKAYLFFTKASLAIETVREAYRKKELVSTLLGVKAKTADTAATAANNKVKTFSIAITSAAVGPMLAFGAAILLMGAGIAVAALGLTQFVKAFSQLTGEQLVAVSIGLTLFVAGMVAMVAILAGLVSSGVLPVVAAGLLGFGAAVLLIGVGIAVAAVGIMLLVKSFASLQDVDLIKVAKGLIAVSVSLATLSISALAIAASFFLFLVAGVILAGFAVVLLALGVASVIAGTGITLFSKGLAELGNLDLDNIAKGIGLLSVAMLGLTAIGAVAVGAVGPVLAFGAAMLLVGGAVLMAGFGFKLAAEGVQNLAKAFVLLVSTGPSLLQFATGIGLLSVAMLGLTAVGAVGGIFTLLGGSMLAAFITGIAIAMSLVTSETITKITAMAKATSILASSLKQIEGTSADVVVNTVKVFESIGNIKGSSGEAAQQAIESFKRAVIDVRAQNKIQLELTINHNNIKATDASLQEFASNLNKVLNKGRA